MAYQQYPNKNATLWMGDVDQYMDENFLSGAFMACGETVISVKIIRNKNPGWTGANYAFIEFPDQETAQQVLLKLNGKPVPNSNPSTRFKLNHSSYNKDNKQEYSLFVGDLTEDVDDLSLYNAFIKKFPSLRGAKVVHDADGRSKGFGFVRFGEETDQQRALTEMNLSRGLGRKLIRVSMATPKRGLQNNQGNRGGYTQSGGYSSQAYGQSGYDQSGGYNNYYNYWQQQYPGYYNNMEDYGEKYQQGDQSQQMTEQVVEEEVQDPEIDIDVENENRIFMEQSEELYMALEGSRWHPLDNVMSTIIPTQGS